MSGTRDLGEAVILVGAEDNVSVALVCLLASDVGDVDLEGYGFGVDSDGPFLQSPDGSTRLNLPADSYPGAMLAMEKEAVMVRLMDLEARADRDVPVRFLEEAPAPAMGAP